MLGLPEAHCAPSRYLMEGMETGFELRQVGWSVSFGCLRLNINLRGSGCEKVAVRSSAAIAMTMKTHGTDNAYDAHAQMSPTV